MYIEEVKRRLNADGSREEASTPASDGIAVPALWRLERGGHIVLNVKENENAWKALLSWIDGGEIESQKDATVVLEEGGERGVAMLSHQSETLEEEGIPSHTFLLPTSPTPVLASNPN
jgi:hypothetical protein